MPLPHCQSLTPLFERKHRVCCANSAKTSLTGSRPIARLKNELFFDALKGSQISEKPFSENLPKPIKNIAPHNAWSDIFLKFFAQLSFKKARISYLLASSIATWAATVIHSLWVVTCAERTLPRGGISKKKPSPNLLLVSF